jgi:hypothetical protein
MRVFSGISSLIGATDPGPPVTELVPVRVHGHDPSWPPVLVFLVAAVALGGLFAAAVFLRRAWGAAHPTRRTFDA